MANNLTTPHHRPGPWYAVEYAGFWEIQVGPLYLDASVLNEQYFPGRAAYNAQLAATAPDLLECVRDAVSDLAQHMSPGQLAHLQEIILKATTLQK